MEEEMEVKELQFAQSLCSNQPKIRKGALRQLREYISNTSKNQEFTHDNFVRLTRGLHYAMWMQDKMILQEELSDSYGSYIELFNTEAEVVEYLRIMYRTISKHWGNMDRWRMDKYLQLVRRLIRSYFLHLRDKKWANKVVDEGILLFRQTLITPHDGGVLEGLKLHFASVYLEELDHAGDLPADKVMKFLEPYVQQLEDPLVSDNFFASIYTEIFNTILERFAADLEKEELDEEDVDKRLDGDLQAVGKPLEFDYAAIAERLNAVVNSDRTKAKRKRQLAHLADQFGTAARGEDPFETIFAPKKKRVTKGMIDEAATRLYAEQKKGKKQRANFKKARRQIRKRKDLSAF